MQQNQPAEESEALPHDIHRSLERIQNELRLLRIELQHNRELMEQRVSRLEKQSDDHETRLRDATNGVTQFRLWTSLSSGGSAILSLTALIKSFFTGG